VGKAALLAGAFAAGLAGAFAAGLAGAFAAGLAGAFAAGLAGLLVVLGSGVAVADDPQAKSRTTNNITIALGQCFMNFVPDLVSDMLPSPFLLFALMY
jgi:hypothetical protein